MQSGGDKSPNSMVAEGLAEFSRRSMIALIVGLVLLLLVLASVAFLVLGFSPLFTDELEIGFAFSFFEIMVLLFAFGVTILAFAAMFLLLYRASRVLRETVEEVDSEWSLRLSTASTLLYYGSLLGLIGSIGLVIVIGALFLIAGLLLVMLGFALLGYEARRLHHTLETPGLLVLVGAVLSLLSLLPLLSMFSAIGYIILLIGLHTMHNATRRIVDMSLLGSAEGGQAT